MPLTYTPSRALAQAAQAEMDASLRSAGGSHTTPKSAKSRASRHSIDTVVEVGSAVGQRACDCNVMLIIFIFI